MLFVIFIVYKIFWPSYTESPSPSSAPPEIVDNSIFIPFPTFSSIVLASAEILFVIKFSDFAPIFDVCVFTFPKYVYITSVNAYIVWPYPTFSGIWIVYWIAIAWPGVILSNLIIYELAFV